MKKEKLKKQNNGCQRPTTKFKTPKGITLVALVITIIILLILAGVAISMITGGDGMFSRAENAATKYNEAAKNEANTLEYLIHELNKATSDIKVTGTNITARSFDINVDIQGITEEITKIEYYVNDELLATTTDRLYTVENLNTDTEYQVYVKMYNEKNQEYISNRTTIKTLPIIAKLEATYVGTRQFEVTTTIENGDSEITEIEYFVDDTSVEKQAERTYTSSEYDPETTHKVYAKAYNANGEEWTTNELTITTEPRTYLYKDGDECLDITGGWYNTTPFVMNIARSTTGNLTKNTNNMYFWMSTAGNNSLNRAALRINNEIDYTQYNKIYIDYEAWLTKYSDNLCVDFISVVDNTLYGYEKLCYTSKASRRTSGFNIFGVNFFEIAIQNSTVGGAWCYVYNIWLEK